MLQKYTSKFIQFVRTHSLVNTTQEMITTSKKEAERDIVRQGKHIREVLWLDNKYDQAQALQVSTMLSIMNCLSLA